MAVDPSLHHTTEALILPKPRKYYRASIQTSHWQLRSLLSSPENRLLYYPSGADVYVLDTQTNEREVVTTLSFSPRCVTVAKGWLCCGGDAGNYTVLNLQEGKTTPSLGADPDARLPIDLDPSRRSIPRDTSSTSRRTLSSRYPLPATAKKIGTEIVNCITLWFPSESTSEYIYTTPVAVVANNDCTVHILDLEDDSETLETLTFPDFVNRSVMSPDGQFLVTICDDPFLYIHQRKKKPAPAKGHVRQQYDWSQWGRIQLVGQRQADKSNMRGSFAASFSKSGKYLAVATQYGMISVFETEYLTDDTVEPLVIFTTSRPNRECGAVRAMEFSPEPFDLLAWTESSGRVGVADVRNLFLSRQLVIIDSRADGIEKVQVAERHPEPTMIIDPRLRSFRTESPSSNITAPDYLGLDFDRRQISQLTRELSDRHRSPVTAEELEILSAHQIARRQRDAAAAASPSAWGSVVTRQNGEGSSSTDRRIATAGSTAGYPAALREFINPDRTAAASFRSFINERNQERDRRLQQQPRRRSSIILAAAEQSIERETLGPNATRNNNDPSTSLERLTLTPPRLLNYPTNPWTDSDAMSRSRLLTELPLDRSARLRVELEDDDRRDFAHRLRQPWRPIDDLNPIGLGSRDESTILRGVLRSGPVETMGCCWSPDGRILYVGAEDGIHEFHVNVSGRRRFPSLVLR